MTHHMQNDSSITATDANVERDAAAVHHPVHFVAAGVPAATIADGIERAEFATRVGARWQEDNTSIIDNLPHGTGVAVNVDDGRYVTARNTLEAMDEFERQFAPGAVAFVFRVGMPLRMGGWAW